MKRHLHLVLILIFILVFTGCKEEEINKVTFLNNGIEEASFSIKKEDFKKLLILTESKRWEEGESDCLFDYKIILKGETFFYHTSCGTLNKLDKSLSLSPKEKIEINKILEGCKP